MPDTGLGSVATAANKISLALLGLTSGMVDRPPIDILTVIQGIMTGFAPKREVEMLGTQEHTTV